MSTLHFCIFGDTVVEMFACAAPNSIDVYRFMKTFQKRLVCKRPACFARLDNVLTQTRMYNNFFSHLTASYFALFQRNTCSNRVSSQKPMRCGTPGCFFNPAGLGNELKGLRTLNRDGYENAKLRGTVKGKYRIKAMVCGSCYVDEAEVEGIKIDV